MKNKLLTPLKIGEIELRHRVILEWPLISGPSEIEKFASLSSADLQLSGGLIIFDPGPLNHLDPGAGELNGLSSVGSAWRNEADTPQLSHQSALARLRSNLSLKLIGSANGINALTQRDIDKIVDDYSDAAYRAKSSGFIGVELDGSRGSAIDLFLMPGSNLRSDRYGGPIIQRVGFLMELVETVTRAFGPDRVGVRLSPFARGIVENVRRTVFNEVLRSLHDQEIAYIHIELTKGIRTLQSSPFAQALRNAYPGIFVTSGQQDIRSATQLVESRWSDAAYFLGPKVGALFLTQLRRAWLGDAD